MFPTCVVHWQRAKLFSTIRWLESHTDNRRDNYQPAATTTTTTTTTESTLSHGLLLLAPPAQTRDSCVEAGACDWQRLNLNVANCKHQLPHETRPPLESPNCPKRVSEPCELLFRGCWGRCCVLRGPICAQQLLHGRPPPRTSEAAFLGRTLFLPTTPGQKCIARCCGHCLRYQVARLTSGPAADAHTMHALKNNSKRFFCAAVIRVCSRTQRVHYIKLKRTRATNWGMSSACTTRQALTNDHFPEIADILPQIRQIINRWVAAGGTG